MSFHQDEGQWHPWTNIHTSKFHSYHSSSLLRLNTYFSRKGLRTVYYWPGACCQILEALFVSKLNSKIHLKHLTCSSDKVLDSSHLSFNITSTCDGWNWLSKRSSFQILVLSVINCLSLSTSLCFSELQLPYL